MTVRPARAEDLAAVVSLEQEALGADAWSPGLLEEGVLGRVPYAHYLVAEVENEDDRAAGPVVAGHAVVSVVADVAELQRIGVAHERRRRGLATALLDAVAAQAGRAVPRGCCSRCARTTPVRWPSTPRAASPRSTGVRGTTATVPPRS